MKKPAEKLAVKLAELARAAAREQILELLDRLANEPAVAFEVRSAASVVRPFFEAPR